MRIALALLLLLASTAHGATREYVVDVRHSTVGFSIAIAGGLTSVDGAFRKYRGNIQYDAEDPTRSSVDVTIETASIDTGQAGRDEHLRTADFFDATAYPEIRFHTERVERNGAEYALVGPLTMHGVTRTVRIAARRTHVPPRVWVMRVPTVVIEGSTTLSRKDFGIAGTVRWNSIVEATGAAAMADEVTIRMRIIGEGQRVDAELLQVFEKNGLDAALARYDVIRAELTEPGAFGPETLTWLAGALQRKNELAAADRVRARNAELYPARSGQ